MLIQDIILPKKYLTNKNCNMPAGHIALSCYFVTQNEFDNSIVFTVNTTSIVPVDGDLALTIDTINEFTSGDGVTVDGVVMKDGGVVVAKANVTQATSITTTVVANGPSGTITTVSSTIAADASETFTVTNSFATTTSNIQLTARTAGAGIPVPTIGTKSNGSFTIKLYNAHSSSAFNNTILIDYLIS